ncbi:benzoate/H(+) symporter BenE family transporter [Calidifontibacillus erzurumensis]|uniref:benzoate/H(+) symporter BenE family transporter n=1 Tax=Calidifontibacillus erzurumensis TaxID=2741433 RepID=UPI002E790D05|nr:benzoate/H(+) symporter BenE family transporter [Calidifontibacillus erzurumensis]
MFFKDCSFVNISNGTVAWLFGISGPLIIVLSSAAKGQLSETELTSWVFSIYVVGGLLSIILSMYYKQPIAVAFTIPGAIIVGSALVHHSFQHIIGAYVITGMIIVLLGLSGIISKIMTFLPMPIMMGMVSGVLLPFGIHIIEAIKEDPFIHGAIFATYLVLTFFSNSLKKFPPIIGAMLAAAILYSLFRPITIEGITFAVAVPKLFAPSFNLATIGEVVVPLLLTVIAIQNAQGIGVLKSMNFNPPVNAMTKWSGIGSIINSFFGAHSACIAGPMTGILANVKAKETAYTGAVWMGILWVVFGFSAPFAVSLTAVLPSSFILLLGGLALLGVLKNTLEQSFSSNFKMGALFSFMITISEIEFLNIGAPFWGLAFGTIVSFIMEKEDFKLMNINFRIFRKEKGYEKEGEVGWEK